MNTQTWIRTLLPVAMLTAGVLKADSVYRDPQGRFTILVPTGWTHAAAESSLQLSRGAAYTTLMMMGGEGTPEQLAGAVIEQIQRQWKDAKQMGSQEATLGGQRAVFAALVGTNPRGVQSFAGVYAASIGGQLYVLMQSGPVTEFRQLAQEMDKIANSFSQGSGSSSAPSSGFSQGPGSASAPIPVTLAGGSTPPQAPMRGMEGSGSNYEAPDQSVSFRVPSGWKARSADLGGTPIQILERQGGEEKILVNSGAATANSIQELTQQAMQAVTQQLLPGFRASNPSFSQMNGVPTAEISYTGNAGGGQATWFQILMLKDQQFLSVLGGGLSAQAQMVQQQSQSVFRSVRMAQMRPNTQAAQSLVGRWTWYHRTEGIRTRDGGISTSKQIVFHPNGRFDYLASTYAPGMPTNIDPETRVSGRYQVTGNTIIATLDNGQRATYNFRFIQGGALEINGDTFIRE